MSLPKCKECLSCMHPVHVDNRRYFYCDFCNKWLGGMTKDLIEVENPYLVDTPDGKVDRRLIKDELLV